jgi:hypothetical protein
VLRTRVSVRCSRLARRTGVLLGASALIAGLAACSDTRTASGNVTSPLDAPPTATPDAFDALPTGPIFLPLSSWAPAAGGRAQALDPCLRQPYASLGADAYRVRAFASRAGASSRAQDVLVVFRTEKAAAEGFFIFNEWHDTCARRLDDDRDWEREASTRVAGAGDAAAWFSVTADDTERYTTGVIRSGTTVALVTVRNTVGSSESWNPRRTMTTMLQRAGRRL